MIERGITPDVGCATNLIKAYGKIGETQKAVDTLLLMKDLSITPDINAYNTALSVCVNNAEFHLMEEILTYLSVSLPQTEKAMLWPRSKVHLTTC